jgi:methionine-S-sulfoxide reductase
MIEKIVLGGGCFWCIEAAFQKIKGIKNVEPGYAGGRVASPTYELVCTGRTGHAEVVLVEYEESEISLEEILEVFFAVHDPTTLNRQGADVGEQYRSIILWTKPKQEQIIKVFMDKLRDKYPAGMVTEVKKLEQFHPAENYHRNYYLNNKNQPYCRLIIEPKIKKVEKEFSGKLQ